MPRNYLSITHPHLKKEWDFEKNILQYENVTTNNSKKAHWTCELNHKWEAIIAERSKGSSCPYCSNKKVLEGFNDLATTHPEIAAQWHPTKNNGLSPQEVIAGTAKQATWLGECGHEWEARINARTKQKQNCPYCFGNKVIAGVNDLASQYPEIAKQWHSSRNSKFPAEVHKNSQTKYWWVGDCGHEWETSVHMRTQRKSGCTKCNIRGGNMRKTFFADAPKSEIKKVIRRVKPGVNDLATVSPDVAKQWHPTKNGSFLAHQVAAFSQEKAWWLGECGHEWRNPIVTQTRKGNCPYCTGKRFTSGINDLETMNPKLASEWDSTKNLLLPTEVKAGTNRKAWWLCQKGHSWEASMNRRLLGSGCPVCSNFALLVGFNDLASKFPNLALQYNSVRNKNSPSEITYVSTKNVWWLCEKGHEWKNSPKNRTYNRNQVADFKGNGCPQCSAPVSLPEQQVFDFIVNDLGLAGVVQSDRQILKGRELDIYIPELNVAIEFNGLYWHSEAQGKGANYHLNKWLECKHHGIQLIQVWEDDWREKQELWKRMLSVKLHQGNPNGTVYARKTEIKQFNYKDVQDFLTENHLQGPMSGSGYFGLVEKGADVLVALLVVTLKNDGTVLEITRFASSKQVPGGFSKLLKEVERVYPEVSKIVSFSENSISVGDVYEKNGFVFDGSMTAYSYISQTNPPRRLHRRNFTKQKYRDRDDLVFEDGLTERELAELNGLSRVWDAGNTKWVKYL